MSELKDRLMNTIANDRQSVAMQKKYDSALVPVKIDNIPSNVRVKLDSFVNIMTKVGTQLDRRTGYSYQADCRLSFQARKDMIKSSAITRIIVNSIVEDALKKDLEIDHEKKEAIQLKLKEIKFKDFFKRACKEGRVHGLAGAFYFINDGNFSDIPVNHEKIKDIKPLFILNKEMMSPLAADYNGNPIPWQAGYEVEFYRISAFGRYEIWHISRILLTYGEYAGEDNLAENNGAYESLIDLNAKAILLLELVTDNVTTLSDQIIQEIIQIEGLEEKLISNKDDDIMAQIMAMMMGKSTVNKLLLDSKDKYSYHSANVSGYSVFYQIAKDNMATSAKMPKTKLFGESPAGGLGETGSYEDDVWDDNVSSYQSDISPQVDKALGWIKKLINISQDEMIIYNFASLKSMSPIQEANLKKTHAETFKIYIDSGVLKPETVGISLFKGKYSNNIQIDDKTIADMEKALNEPVKPEIKALPLNNDIPMIEKPKVTNEQK